MDLKVVGGNNNLDSCYQFVVTDKYGEKLLTIKCYDKLLDLVGRNGYHLVGSRMPVVLGCSSERTSFMKRIRGAQHTGLTRLEISCHEAALQKYILYTASLKTDWHYRIQRAIETLVSKFLNHDEVLKRVYRRLCLPDLVTRLGECWQNMLVIGKSTTWLILASTGHKRHFVGTK